MYFNVIIGFFAVLTLATGASAAPGDDAPRPARRGFPYAGPAMPPPGFGVTAQPAPVFSRGMQITSGGGPILPAKSAEVRRSATNARTITFPTRTIAAFPVMKSVSYPLGPQQGPAPIHLPEMPLASQTDLQYLILINEMREVTLAIENTNTQILAAKRTQATFEDLHAREERLYRAGTISYEEWQESQYNRDLAVTRVKYFESLIEGFKARLEQKTLMAGFAMGTPYNLESIYPFFRQEWTAQCTTGNFAVEEAKLLVRLYSLLLDVANKLYYEAGQVASYYEVVIRQKDLFAAQADLAAKERLDAGCENGLPSLEQMHAMRK